ncbi:MAG: hypothetical protein KAT39_15555 [Alphaproteobacteria bacterium]|nr:hypothetical protein [Alphaproteobacteria bacterium]
MTAETDIAPQDEAAALPRRFLFPLVDLAHGGNAVAVGVGMKPFRVDWPRRYDYVLITHFGAKGSPLPDLLSLVHEGSVFDIYRIAGKS